MPRFASQTPGFYRSDPLTKELGSQLSSRETEVMNLLVQGLWNKEIADCLGISTKTVETHIHHIMERTGIQRRVLLGIWWSKQ